MAQKLETRCVKAFILFKIQSEKKNLFFQKIAFKKRNLFGGPGRWLDQVDLWSIVDLHEDG